MQLITDPFYALASCHFTCHIRYKNKVEGNPSEDYHGLFSSYSSQYETQSLAISDLASDEELTSINI